MQVGFSPINFQQKQNKTQSTNFGCNVSLKHLQKQPNTLFDQIIKKRFKKGDEADRTKLIAALNGIEKYFREEAKWEMPDFEKPVKAIYGDNDKEINKIFEKYA